MIKEFLDANPNPIEPGYVFTLLPGKAKEIYQGYVKKAAESLGLRCESFLDFAHPGDSLRDILASIQKAEILIYDITDLTPNVMWELGLALAIKDAERIIVIREESDASLPFDIYSHRATFQYDPQSEESLTELHKTLRDVMQKINQASSKKAPIQSPEVKSLLDMALKAVKRKEWIVAEALFQTVDAREPENWYIYNQWGIMLRSKGEFEAASEKLNKALTFTNSDDRKVFIYTELAVLHQMKRKYADAEDLFRKAEKADSENIRLYIAWAEYYGELGDYFSAQAKINGALKSLEHEEDGPNYKELMLRHAYYDKKISNRDYKKSFEQFRREPTASPKVAHRYDISKTAPINFTAFYPTQLKLGEWHTLIAYAHKPDALKSIKYDYQARLDPKTKNIRQSSAKSNVAIARGVEVVIVPEMPGCRFNPSQASFLWIEDWHRVEFRMQASPEVSGFKLDVLNKGRLAFYVGPILIAEIKFSAHILKTADESKADHLDGQATTDPYQAIFVSYSHKDKYIVGQLEKTYEVLGFQYLRDVRILRSGELWNATLLKKIDEADIFQLCWSNASKRSTYVEQEWRHALSLNRPSFIRPVYWRKPLPDPPLELEAIHFAYLELRGLRPQPPSRKSNKPKRSH